MSTTDRRDVIEVLSGDHRAVEVLFQRLETAGAGPSGARKALVDALALELAWHTAAAQRYLLPLARRTLPDGDALADALAEFKESFSAALAGEAAQAQQAAAAEAAVAVAAE